MPVNPMTGKEQVYPDESDKKEFGEFSNPAKNESEGKNFVRGLEDKYFSFLFAATEAKKTFDRQNPEDRLDEARTFTSELNDVSQESPRFSVWLSELIQNAIDARWENGTGATEISISFHESEIIFQHNGRPPQYMGYMANEFKKMVVRGTTKKTSFKNEGKFGIGFKFWQFFFDEVNLECENWQIGWDPKGELSEITESDYSSGLKMIFSKPKKEYSQKFTKYKADFEELFDEDLERLIEGIAVQTTSLSITISLEDEKNIQLIHEAKEKEYSTSEKTIRYYEIENKLESSDEFDFDCYVPSKLIGYDANKFHSTDQFQSIDRLANSLEEEFKKNGRSNAFTRELLTEEYTGGDRSEETSLPKGEDLYELIMSEENLKKASLSNLQDIQALCLVDISPRISRHFLMYSLFSLSQYRGSERSKRKKRSRISYVGTYTVNQERTRLEPSNRNNAIIEVQLDSTYLLLNLISNEKFRKINNITDLTHMQILESLEKDVFDDEFITLAKTGRDSE